MRAREINTPQAYWTYLRRYPNGMYAFDAERRLRRLGAAFTPPPGFAMMEFDDVPMALVGEPVEYEEVYRVGPPPPRSLYGAPPRPISPTCRRRGGVAVVTARRIAHPAGARDRDPAGGGTGSRAAARLDRSRRWRRRPSGRRRMTRRQPQAPAAAPASVAPNQAVAPAARR